MLEGILALLNQLFGGVATLLPNSPFSDLQGLTAGLYTGITWLNWVVPVNDMLISAGIWVAACVAVAAVRVGATVVGSVGGKVVGE